METRPVTLRDIANAAGYSHTTVSLALRNHPRIAEATRDRIQRLARQMGYRPNPHVQQLLSQVKRGKVTHSHAGLALVSNYARRGEWQHMPNNKLAILAAFERAAELGYHLEEFSLNHEGMSFARLRKILIARGILGILIAPTSGERMDLQMDVSPFAVVSMGQSLRNRTITMVAHSHAHSMRELLQRLVARGYKRIACCIDAGIDQRIENAWSAYFYHYQQGINTRNRIPLLLRTTPQAVLTIVEHVRKYRADALISDSDETLRLLQGEGWQIPAQIGYANLCVTPGDDHTSGIQQNNHLTGVRAIETLVQLINNGIFGIPRYAQYTYIHGQWNEGNTLVRKEHSLGYVDKI